MPTQFFEVELRNRVIKGLFPIKGEQGKWYTENFYCLAQSEQQAQKIAYNKVKKRRIIGASAHRRKRHLRREVEILEIRRIA